MSVFEFTMTLYSIFVALSLVLFLLLLFWATWGLGLHCNSDQFWSVRMGSKADLNGRKLSQALVA